MSTDKKLKPMTIEEVYRNADVPMPNDLLHASNTEKFKDEDIEAMDNAGIEYTEVIKNSQSDEDYNGGVAYTKFLELFFKGKKKWTIEDQTILKLQLKD